MSKATVPDADPKQQGTVVEELVIERYGALEPVADDDEAWHDARTTAALDSGADLRCFEVAQIPAETPIEIKASQQWISNGSGRQRRGRWYVKRQSHQKLCEADGLYFLVVYEVGGAIKAVAAIPALELDELLAERWCDTDAAWGSDAVAKLSWSQLLPTSAVKGGGG